MTEPAVPAPDQAPDDALLPGAADPVVTAMEVALGLIDEDAAGLLSDADRVEGRELAALATIGLSLPRDGALPRPSAGLRARLLARVREERFHFVHADDGVWAPLAATPGGAAKTLYAGGAAGDRTRLLHLPAAAAEVAELRDAMDPAVVVVAGELEGGDGERFAAGDLVQPAAGEAGAWRSPGGCTLLLVERGGAPGPRRARRLRVDAPGWRPLAPGTEILPVAAGRGERTDVILLRMAAGGLLPEHEHAGLEEIYLLAGSCHCQGTRLAAGDYHRAAGGSEHHDTTTDEGCVMVVVLRKAA
jgi:anti-sigma factor ChrR (cupin superfamily)